MRHWWLVFVCLLAVLPLLISCSDASSASGVPTKLKMAYLPSDDDTERRLNEYTELAEFLTVQIGIPVELIRTAGYGPMIEAMRARKIDFAMSGSSFTYMIAHEKAGAEALAIRGTEAGPGIYRAGIVTNSSTGLNSLEDLKAKQSELVFAFVDPASTSGHLIPRHGLESNGIDPEDFKQVIFTMSHTNSAMTLLSGKVDAGAISLSLIDRMLEADRMQEGDLVVLWESEPIPNGPLIARQELPEELKTKIQQAFLAINDDEALLAIMRRQVASDDMIYLAVDDNHWDGLRDLAAGLESMKLLSQR